MRKKLEGNGLWESSRMILPEHLKAMITTIHISRARHPRTLDDQELEEVQYALTESLNEGTRIRIDVFDEYEDVFASGIVERIDTNRKRILLSGDWIDMLDIQGVERC